MSKPVEVKGNHPTTAIVCTRGSPFAGVVYILFDSLGGFKIYQGHNRQTYFCTIGTARKSRACTRCSKNSRIHGKINSDPFFLFTLPEGDSHQSQKSYPPGEASQASNKLLYPWRYRA